MSNSFGSSEMGEENDLRMGVNQMTEGGKRANQSNVVGNPPVVSQGYVEINAYHSEGPGDGLGRSVVETPLSHSMGRERWPIHRRYEGQKLWKG